VKKKPFKIGDIVVLISDDAIKYMIVSLYGPGNAYAICEYFDTKMNKHNRLSVPVIALEKYKKFVALKDINPSSLALM